jgi:hypothetical protein
LNGRELDEVTAIVIKIIRDNSVRDSDFSERFDGLLDKFPAVDEK